MGVFVGCTPDRVPDQPLVPCPAYGYTCASGALCSRLLFINVHWPCHLGEGYSYVQALRADPFGFFINLELRVWGRGVVAWVEALLLKSLLVNLCPVLLVSWLAVGPHPLRTLIGMP